MIIIFTLNTRSNRQEKRHPAVSVSDHDERLLKFQENNNGIM